MNKCIAVLGMHRSGTSVVTKALEILGVNLGQNIIPVAGDNKKGFWEDSSIIELNDRILALAGMTWFSVSEYPFALLESEEGRALEKEALELISSRLNTYPLWGFKDPRCSRLLPFWQNIFAKLNITLSYLVVLRNPLDIAASLKKRNDFKLAMSQHLWLVHTFQNLKLFKNNEVCFVSFDDFLSTPEEHLQRFSRCFNLSIDETALTSFADDFISPDLRHSYSSNDDLMIRPGIFPFVQKLHLILSKIADSTTDLDMVLEHWDELEREYLATTHASLHEFCLHAHTRNVDVANIMGLLEKNTITLADQHKLIEFQVVKNDQLKNENDQLKNKNDQLKNENRQLKNKNNQLKNENRQLRKNFDLIRKSTTWQMTKPVRYIVTMLKKMGR